MSIQENLKEFINNHYILIPSICDGRFGTPEDRFFDHFGRIYANELLNNNIKTSFELRPYMRAINYGPGKGHNGYKYRLELKH